MDARKAVTDSGPVMAAHGRACVHKSAVPVWRDAGSGVTIYAGGMSRGFAPVPGMLVFDASGQKTPTGPEWVPVVAPFDGAEGLTRWNVQRVALDWPDMGAPSLTLGFWREAVRLIRKSKRPVGVCCIGGHGRTGTALAMLAHVMTGGGIGDPVAWVRKIYCENAVESAAQIEYVRSLTGKAVTSAPSSAYRVYPPVSGGASMFPRATGSQGPATGTVAGSVRRYAHLGD
jgi:hypothetical protein